MADEPVSAGAEPLAERARRWMRRRKSAVTAAVAAVLVASAGWRWSLAVQSRANRVLRVANIREANARRNAQARFELAMDAIRTFHTGVSEDLLLKEVQFEDLRGKLLRGALNFYSKLGGSLKDLADRPSRRALEHGQV